MRTGVTPLVGAAMTIVGHAGHIQFPVDVTVEGMRDAAEYDVGADGEEFYLSSEDVAEGFKAIWSQSRTSTMRTSLGRVGST